MKHIKKVTMVTSIAILISFFSLSLSFSALGTTNALKGVSTENKEVWNIDIVDISTMALESNEIQVIKEPSMVEGAINYALSLNKVLDYAQFQFNIQNDGNVPAVVKNVTISGLEGYEQYIDVTLEDLNIGDVIEADTFKSVTVLTSYKEQMYDINLLPQSIDLNNVNLVIELEKK